MERRISLSSWVNVTIYLAIVSDKATALLISDLIEMYAPNATIVAPIIDNTETIYVALSNNNLVKSPYDRWLITALETYEYGIEGDKAAMGSFWKNINYMILQRLFDKKIITLEEYNKVVNSQSSMCLYAESIAQRLTPQA